MKKLLILISIILFSLHGYSQVYNWSQLSYQAYVSDSSSDMDIITSATPDADNSVGTSLKSGLRWQHEFSMNLSENFSVTIENDLYYSEKSQELRNSYFNNFAKFKLLFFTDSRYLKLQYSNRFYDEENTRILNVPGIDYSTKQRMVHNTGLEYKERWGKIKISFYGELRNLDYEYYPYENNMEDIKSHQAWENDFYSSAELSYDISNSINLFLNGYYKNDLNNETWFDQKKIGFGFQFHKRFDFFNILKVRFTYFHDNADRLEEYLQNSFLTQIRYTKRIGTSLSGFVSYTNNSCYDNEANKLLRISNMLRIHAKYSYLTENLKDSYFLTGIKINPENDGTLFFSELNQYIFKSFYISVGMKCAPEMYKLYAGKFEYFITPDKSIWITEEYKDFKTSCAQHLLSLGITLLF